MKLCFCWMILVTGLSALASAGDGPAGATRRPPSTSAAAAAGIPAVTTNRVEPLSNGLRLSMKKAEVLKQFEGLTEGFGGFVDGRQWNFWYTPGSGDIERCTLKRDIRLACGIGVGDTLAAVREVFPGGATSGGNYRVVHGQYELLFEAYEEAVSRIRISPTGRRFIDTSLPATPKPADVAIASVAGTWHMTQGGAGMVVLQADGTYTTGIGGKGTFRSEGNDLVFKGALEAWNGGRGTLSRESVIEFSWKNPEGFQNHIVLVRGKR